MRRKKDEIKKVKKLTSGKKEEMKRKKKERKLEKDKKHLN
jgi:hypothetical protein